MDVLAQNTGIVSLIIGACGTGLAIAGVAVRLISYVFKKRKRVIEPVRRLLRHLHETAPRENGIQTDEIQTLEKLQVVCDKADCDDMDSGMGSLLMLLSPQHASGVLTSAYWLVESYALEFESMRDQKQFMATGACVYAVSSVAESVISLVEFVHKAFEAARDKRSTTVFSPVDLLQTIYTAVGDSSLTHASANDVLRNLVIFLGGIIRFDKMLKHDTVCPERYTLWPNEDEQNDMSLYLVKVRDEIRDVLMQDIRPYRFEGAKSRRAAIIQESASSSSMEDSEPSKKRQRTGNDEF